MEKSDRMKRMKEQIEKIGQAGEESISTLKTMVELDAWEITYLGRKSELNNLLKGLRDLSPEDKKIVGPLGIVPSKNSLLCLMLRKKNFLKVVSTGSRLLST